MSTPDGWQVELVRFTGAPVYRVSCDIAGSPHRHREGGLWLSIGDLVSVLGDSFELLAADEVAERQSRPA